MHVLFSDTFIVTKNIPDLGITVVKKKEEKTTYRLCAFKQTKKETKLPTTLNLFLCRTRHSKSFIAPTLLLSP